MRTCPEYCLNLTVRKASNDLELLKTIEQLKPDENLLRQIRHENPEEFYDRSVLIYKSGGNEGVYRTYSIPEGKPHILKVTSETMEQGLENDLILKSETLL